MGKTTLLDVLKNEFRNDLWSFVHFDSVGVPSLAEMERSFGSPSAWQKFQTFKWIDWLVTECNHEKIFFEGQVNPQFIKDGFARHSFQSYVMILIDCSEEAMRQRLTFNRQQAELYTDKMVNWLRYLRSMASETGMLRLDTTNLSPDQMAQQFKVLINL